VWRLESLFAPRRNGSEPAKIYRRQLAFGAIIASGFVFSFIAGMAVSVATAPVEAGLFEQIVIRTNKGDRLRWLPVSNPKKQPPDVDEFGLPAEENLRLPEGCDSSVSPVANARAARVASYCVS
jgi:hypothetical protein